ncbi:MAG: hypothetical protein APR63_12355 [Desulfuromonas sp. SDB]|nr:MAG: hypothetical protein APR63_12355 [Desulfuromonas sp. SDB]
MLIDSILKNLEVYGYESIEKPLLACLLTREPILLIGSHGTGKTLLSYTLAKALGYKVEGEEREFHAYDASKSLFEDIIGFPDPEKMKEGRVDYLNSAITIWNKKFILIDEISRANSSMQNKWLEIIRSRSVMGKDISGLEYIFAAMNPVEYPGANPLDPALADRFSLIVKIPDIFSHESISGIINSLHRDDSPGLRKEKTCPEKSDQRKLKKLLSKIKEIYENLPEELVDTADKFSKMYYQNAFALSPVLYLTVSPRRASMIFRNLKIFLSIDLYHRGSLSREDILVNLNEIAGYSWIYSAGEEEYSDYREEVLYKTLYDIGMIRVNEFEKRRTENFIQNYKNSISPKKKLVTFLKMLFEIYRLQQNPSQALEQDVSVFKIIDELTVDGEDMEGFPLAVKNADINWCRLFHNFRYLQEIKPEKLKRLVKQIKKEEDNYDIKTA